jgi:hypothetical protein
MYSFLNLKNVADKFVHPHILPYTGSNGVPVLGMRGKIGQQTLSAQQQQQQFSTLATPPPSVSSSSSSSSSASPPLDTPTNVNLKYSTPLSPVPEPEHLWFTPSEYYTNLSLTHGSNNFSNSSQPEQQQNFLINHGMCEVCYLEIANLFFPQLVGNAGTTPTSAGINTNFNTSGATPAGTAAAAVFGSPQQMDLGGMDMNMSMGSNMGMAMGMNVGMGNGAGGFGRMGDFGLEKPLSSSSTPSMATSAGRLSSPLSTPPMF